MNKNRKNSPRESFGYWRIISTFINAEIEELAFVGNAYLQNMHCQELTVNIVACGYNPQAIATDVRVGFTFGFDS